MKEIYAWVPWFRELAGKIAKGGEAYLIERAKRVDWRTDNPALLQYGDKNIDPFSFFYFLAQKNSKKQRKRVFSSLRKEFAISSKLPNVEDDEQWIFPTPTPVTPVLFHDGVHFSPKALWKLFRQAVADADGIDADDFKKVLDIKKVAVVKLTQCLYLINPDYFIPVDQGMLKFHEGLALPSLREAEEQIKQQNGWQYYKDLIGKFRAAVPECRPYEIDISLWRMGQWEREGTAMCGNFFQVSTYAHDESGGDFWKAFSTNNYVFTGGPYSGKSWKDYKQDEPVPPRTRRYPVDEPERGDIIFVRTGTSQGRGIGIVHKNDYAQKGGLNADSKIHVFWLNKTTVELKDHSRLPGFSTADLGSGSYKAFANTKAYKPTFKLIQHIRKVPMNTPLNRILYGPPGTGKTWNTVNHALAIIEGKDVTELEEEGRDPVKQRFNALKESGQIEMVTFHQNFAYEDFIEGIRPVMDDGDVKGISYQIENGVFKRICKRAAKIDLNANDSHQLSEKSVWKMSLGNGGEIKELCFEEGTMRIGWSDAGDLRDPKNKYLSNKKTGWKELGRFFKSMLKGDFVAVPSDQEHIDAVGRITSDYEYTPDKNPDYPHSREVEWIRRGGPWNVWTLNDRKKLRPPTCSKLPSVNARDLLALIDDYEHPREDKPHVLIIDEINRGNIAKIFGELITLIEETKRIGGKEATRATLPYSRMSFGVPDNLYIIGTMNTADRSIALLDTALRRRFDFIEMMPEPNHPRISKDIEGVDCQKLLSVMNKRITALLDREHQIGHSYLIDVDSMKNLAGVFQNKIIPLLQEYFYDNWAKIDLVLDGNGFVLSADVENNLFGDNDLVDADRKIYELIEVKDPKWTESESYKKIYARQKAGGGTDAE